MSRTSRADKRTKQKRARRNLEKTLAHRLKAAATQTRPRPSHAPLRPKLLGRNRVGQTWQKRLLKRLTICLPFCTGFGSRKVRIGQ